MERKRPGALLAIAIVGILLGTLGTCGGLFGVVGPLMQGALTDFSRDMAEMSSGGNEAMAQRQIEMQQRIEAITADWQPVLIALQALNLIASLGLLIACILLLRAHPRAVSLFIAFVVVSIVADIGIGAAQMWIQQATGVVMQEYMSDLGSDPAMPAGMDRTMGAAMNAGTTLGYCFGVAWLLLKLGYYVTGIIILRKPEAQAFLAAK